MLIKFMHVLKTWLYVKRQKIMLSNKKNQECLLSLIVNNCKYVLILFKNNIKLNIGIRNTYISSKPYDF